jgi:hypothetical protein
MVYKNFKETYPCDSQIKISTRKDKKYMIYNPYTCKWFHFGSTMEDFTRHGDSERRERFLTRNNRFKNYNMYTPAYSSYYLLW